jgi:hypothetical protein
MQALERYCSWLEGRVVAFFDAAVAENDVGGMAACVRIMQQFDRERAIAQVRRPMRLDAGLWAAHKALGFLGFCAGQGSGWPTRL